MEISPMGPADSTDSLLKAWAVFCDQLKGVGQALLQSADAAPPLDRDEGLRCLSRLVSLGLALRASVASWHPNPGFFLQIQGDSLNGSPAQSTDSLLKAR
jgi:hypothetical protein